MTEWVVSQEEKSGIERAKKLMDEALDILWCVERDSKDKRGVNIHLRCTVLPLADANWKLEDLIKRLSTKG